MMPIIKWTLWQRRWSAFWWSLGVSAFIFINMIFYTTLRDQAAEHGSTVSRRKHGFFLGNWFSKQSDIFSVPTSLVRHFGHWPWK
jgi:hypothetical protein